MYRDTVRTVDGFVKQGSSPVRFVYPAAGSWGMFTGVEDRSGSDWVTPLVYCRAAGRYPAPRKTFPGSTLVILPSAITGTPFTSTYCMPIDN